MDCFGSRNFPQSISESPYLMTRHLLVLIIINNSLWGLLCPSQSHYHREWPAVRDIRKLLMSMIQNYTWWKILWYFIKTVASQCSSPHISLTKGTEMTLVTKLHFTAATSKHGCIKYLVTNIWVSSLVFLFITTLFFFSQTL